MRFSFFILFFFVSAILSGQTMHISIFNNQDIQSYTVSVRAGKYLLVCDNEKFGEYHTNNIFFISKFNNKVEIRDKNTLIGQFDNVELIPKSKNCIFSAKGIIPSTKLQEYDDGLRLKILDNKFYAINQVDLEKYIAGVIEAEGGINAPLEYYKAQAVLIRTYTIKNIYKHAEEDFNLCDQVHCQAYNGRNARNPEIYEATKATSGQVLIDPDSILVMSPFHSSCGGQTSPAGIYWQTDLLYLQSVHDPFCLEQRNANWEERTELVEWLSFLRNLGVNKPNEYVNYTVSDRRKFFVDNKVTFRQIREKFGLKSTFFSIHPEGSQIVFSGKGFGHGIGMCQLGAMEMARVGYTYIDIIHFYFQHVQITDYREMELHRY
ncbi:MAG: SpoIID/LytB domain-containing protein [Bacteroidales bacterium]|nr:SpoIID/LytB domain-containing protein [Bacteroidales bacterium]MBN2819605.1 SpoIID/LytB domain-containing protein [Bacteroidales bacterium]